MNRVPGNGKCDNVSLKQGVISHFKNHHVKVGHDFDDDLIVKKYNPTSNKDENINQFTRIWIIPLEIPNFNTRD